jgi:tetratricopeptide (TPR) repeat protein
VAPTQPQGANDTDPIELRVALAKARALVLAGRTDDAAPLVEAVLVRARRPVEAEAAHVLGELELARGRPQQALDALGRAMAAAVAVGDSRVLAAAAIDHARACLELRRFDQGLQSIALGRGALERLGAREELDAELLAIEGALQVAAGVGEAGRATLRRAAEIAADDATRAAALDRLATASVAIGDLDGAEQTLQRAVALREAALGARHPEVALTLDAWSDVAFASGRAAQALDLGVRALAILEEVLGPEDARVIATRVDVGRARGVLGHHREALDELRRAVEVGTRALGPSHATVVEGRAELARVHQAERAWGPALVEIEQVLALRRGTLGDRHPLVAGALVRLAEIRRGEGRRDLARTAAEQALAMLGPADDPGAFAGAHLVLVDLAWQGGDATRARALANQGAATLLSIGPRGQRGAAELQGWIEAHRAREPVPPVVVPAPGAPPAG